MAKSPDDILTKEDSDLKEEYSKFPRSFHCLAAVLS